MPRLETFSSTVFKTKLCEACPFKRVVMVPQSTTELGMQTPSAAIALCYLDNKPQPIKPVIDTRPNCTKLKLPGPIHTDIRSETDRYRNPTVAFNIAYMNSDLYAEVLQTYATWVGGNVEKYVRLGWSYFLQGAFANISELRVGSWGTEHSKLQMHPFNGTQHYFEFYYNSSWNKEFGNRLAIQFNYQIDQLLRARGIAQDITFPE